MRRDIVVCEVCKKEHDRLDSFISEDFTKTSTMFWPLHVVALCSKECRKRYIEQRNQFAEFISMQPWG